MGTQWVDRAAEELRRRTNPDGGFGPRAGQPTEPEPTALVAMALGLDLPAMPGAQVSTAATPLVALAMPSGAARERMLDALAAMQAQPAKAPRGWGWTPTTYGWVEPTS